MCTPYERRTLSLHDKDDTCGDPDSLREGGPSLVEHEHHKLRQRHLAVLVLVGDRHHRGDLLSGGGGVDGLDGGGELGVRDGAISVRVDLVERVGQLAARRRPRAALLLRAEGLPPLLGLGHVLRLCGEARDARLDRGAHDRGVGTPRGDHTPLERVGTAVEGGLRVRARRLHAPLLLHPHHLVAHDLAPVRAVLVGLHHRHALVSVVVEHERLLLGHVALGAVARRVERRVDDRDLPAGELVLGDHHAERGERGRVVLDDHAVVHAQHRAIGHVPPADRLLVPSPVRVEHARGRGDVTAVLLRRRVGLEPEVVIVVLVRVRHDDRLVRRVVVRHRRVEAELPTLLVVDSADLEAVLCSLDDARVALAVARRAGGHAADLRKDARAAVVAAGESDRILVVVREVEVAREPRLDGRVVAHDLDEILG
mmetsp:Transcript_1887/g.5706  ORF Transcript_1887/g.5706 Transcript_1887/m.5706 type:complete len:426 (-) Transcript_1887:744-2021(-)